MMDEVVAVVVDTETISSAVSASAQFSADFKDPLGVNDHMCAAVIDNESDEFDFDVSLSCTSYFRVACREGEGSVETLHGTNRPKIYNVRRQKATGKWQIQSINTGKTTPV